MYPLTRWGRLAAVEAFVLVAAGCASMNVNSYVERGYDFGQFHTYAWGSAAPSPTGDPRLDSNPFFDERVRAEVDDGLAARGLEKTTSRSPDVTIHYHVNMTQRIDVTKIDREYGTCANGNCRPEVYDAGTILIDLVDPRTNKVIWRGWAEDSMDGVIDDQGLMDAKIGRAIGRILEKLPRRLAG